MGTRSDVQVHSIRAMEREYGDKVEFVYPENHVRRMFHDFARNGIVEDFLKTDCDVLFFLDSDVSPPPEVMDILVDHGDKWLVAGAPYPLWLKGESPTRLVKMAVWNRDEAGRFILAPCPRKGTGWVDCIATGCIFIKRRVLEEMEEPYFEFKFKPHNRDLAEGEDIGFGRKMNELGYKFFIDYGKVCRHYKTVDLLEVNDYAITMSNDKILSYDAEIRPKVEALEAQLRAKMGAQANKSNLIIPTR